MFSELKSPYRELTHITFTEPSLTEQAHKDDCDIAIILKRYQQTGVIEHNNALQGSYDEYPDPIDFHEAQNIIAQAKSMFETVPSKIRRDFDNDPAKFLAFVQDEQNIEQMAAYGLTNPLQEINSDPVPKLKTEPKSSPAAKEKPSGDSAD